VGQKTFHKSFLETFENVPKMSITEIKMFTEKFFVLLGCLLFEILKANLLIEKIEKALL